MKRKGILLAGGKGTRLHPITKSVSKHLLPVFDKPMIYYPLTTLMQTGITEILVIVNEKDLQLFRELLLDGKQWGVNIEYAVQKSPNGLAEALIIAEDFLMGNPSVLILGDNIFFGENLKKLLTKASHENQKASVFTFEVKTPERYGVAHFDEYGKILKITEKPKNPQSASAITGIYFLDEDAPKIAKKISYSDRNELEITDVLNNYCDREKLQYFRLERGSMWFDAGTHESLLSCANFVRSIDLRQNFKLGCPEETAFNMGFIDVQQLTEHIVDNKGNKLSEYLNKLLERHLKYGSR